MDIQKEKDLLQEAFEVVTDEMGFCLDQKWGDDENPYENSDTALAFNLFKKGWQAKSQAVQNLHYEILVKSIIEHVDSHIAANHGENDLFDRGWNAAMRCIRHNIEMLEAQEPAND